MEKTALLYHMLFASCFIAPSAKNRVEKFSRHLFQADDLYACMSIGSSDSPSRSREKMSSRISVGMPLREGVAGGLAVGGFAIGGIAVGGLAVVAFAAGGWAVGWTIEESMWESIIITDALNWRC